MAKKNKSMIGHDPLAWLKDDAEDTDVSPVEKSSTSKTKKKKKATTKKKPEKASVKKKENKSKNKDEGIVYVIQSIQDVSTVSEVYEEMKKLLSDKKVIIDGENIERIDAASLQLIYLFIEEAKMKNIDLSWRNPSESLSNAAKLLGMAEALQLDKVA